MYDDEVVEVPLQYMRNALWYYENYFILRDTIDQQDEIINSQQEMLEEWEEDFDIIYGQHQNAEARVQLWKVFGLTSGVFAVVLLVLEIYDEVRNNSTSTY